MFFKKFFILCVFAALLITDNAYAACTYTYTGCFTGTSPTSADTKTYGTKASPATLVTASNVLRAATTQVASIISNRISKVTTGVAPSFDIDVSRNGKTVVTGLSAGDEDTGASVWFTGSWTSVENTATSLAFDGDIYTFLAGMDAKLDDSWLAGVSLGYDSLDIDTFYNRSILTNEAGSLRGEALTLAPYVSYILTDHISSQLTMGYSWVNYDSIRFDPGTGTSVIGSTDASRYFVNGNVAAHYEDGLMRYRGDAGFLYAVERKDTFTENDGTVQLSSDTHLSQLRANTELGYAMENVEPYAKVGLEYDLSKTGTILSAGQPKPADDDFGALLGGGLRFNFPDSSTTGSLEATTMEFRQDYSEYTLQGNIKIKF